MKATLISIDPGVGGTGVALWIPSKPYPIHTKLLQPDKTQTWTERMYYICEGLQDILHKYKPQEAIIEQPTFLRSKFGIAAAASGNLVKLSMIAGAILFVCKEYGCDSNTVLPARWKGKKKKEDTQRAIRRILPDLKVKNHNTLDAVGVGLYHFGKLKGGVVLKTRL